MKALTPIKVKTPITIIALFLFLNTVNAQSFVWAKSVGSVYDENISSIRIDNQHNLIICGNCSGNCLFGAIMFPDSAAFIAKYDSTGYVNWVIRAGNYSAGGTFLPFLYTNLEINSQNEIYAIGAFADTGIVGSITLTSTQPENIFLAKIDSGGNIIWARRIADHADGLDIAFDLYNNIIITGHMRDTAHFDSVTFINYGSPLTPDIFIAKYDSSGILLWAKQAGGTNFDVAYSVSCDDSANIFIGGELNGDANFDAATLIVLTHSGFVAKYNAAGNAQWVNYSGYCSFAVAADSAGNCYSGGYYYGSAVFDTISLSYPVGSGIFVAKLNPAGAYQWARGSSAYINSSEVTELKIDESGNCYAIGNFEDSLYVDNVHFTQPGPIASTHAAFILEFTPSGQAIAGKRSLNVSPSDAFATAFDVKNCEVAFAGVFRDTPPAIYFDNDSLLSNGMHDMFISRMNSCLATATASENSFDLFTIYPNPNDGVFSISLTANIRNGKLTIYSVPGQIVFENSINSVSRKELHVRNISPGIYFIKVFDGETSYCKKLIVEQN